MQKLKICENISLDSVIQQSADENNLSYTDWTVPYRTPKAEIQSSPPTVRNAMWCLAVEPTMRGRTYGQRRQTVRWRTALILRSNMS